MNLNNVLIIIILILVMIPAVRSTLTHLKGEGACCGGPKEKVPAKVIKGTKLGTYIVKIEGMHCDSCRNRIMKKLNEIDGVTAKVSLSRKQAVVSYYQPVDEDQIRKTIERLDFTVVSITNQ